MDGLIGRTVISLRRGDITRESVDAIVNAANSTLLGGGGVDGAIHRAGGPAILEECREIAAAQGGCPTGQSVITTAGELPSGYVIHTVGPIWNGGMYGEEALLRSAYRTSLEIAARKNLRTVAFPSISTGAYRFPLPRAARLALRTIIEHCRANPEAHDEVRMVLFADVDLEMYEEALEELLSHSGDALDKGETAPVEHPSDGAVEGDSESESTVEAAGEAPAEVAAQTKAKAVERTAEAAPGGMQLSLLDGIALDDSE